MRLTDELDQLHSLYVRGAMTADEYEKAKAKLLDVGNPPQEANDQSVAFDWGAAAEQSPLDKAPSPNGEVTGKDVLTALEIGAVAGAVIGIALSFVSVGASFAHGDWFFVSNLIVGAFVGTIVWTGISLGVKATSQSRGLGALLLRLLYGLLVVVYTVALLIILGFAIYVKMH